MHGSEPYDAFLTDELLGIIENARAKRTASCKMDIDLGSVQMIHIDSMQIIYISYDVTIINLYIYVDMYTQTLYR